MKDWSQFGIRKSAAYDAYPLVAPERELGEESRTLHEKLLQESPGAKPKSAVWVVHGMGQQVPFATLEQVAEGICTAANRSEIGVVGPKYREVRGERPCCNASS
jgi:hypothetical protein